MGKQCQRHTMLESGGSTTLGQRYALFVKARNGINHVKAIKTADKVLSPYLESQGFLSLEADNIKTDEEWAAVKMEMHFKSIFFRLLLPSKGINKSRE